MVLNDSGYKEQVLPAPELQSPEADDFAFWDDYCRSYIDPLLDAAHYSDEDRESHRAFIREYVIPAIGPRPRPSVAKPRMAIAPHGCPSDPSINFTAKKALARFGFAVNGPQSFTAEDPLGVETSYAALAKFARDTDSCVDLRWLDCLMALYPSPDSIHVTADSSLYKNYSRRVAFAAAVDFDGSRRNVKAYVSPFIKHAMTGISENEIVFDAIKSLQPGGPALRPAIKILEDYLSTRTEKFYLGNQFIGIDCTDPSKARVKLYMATNTARFDFIQAAMTLSGRLNDEYTTQGMNILRDIWHLLLDEPEGISDDFNKPRNKLANALPGVFVSYEIRAGVELPDIKVYVPMWLYHRSDEAVAGNLDQIFTRLRDRKVLGKWAWDSGIGERYQDFFKKTL
ncbi:romatic prenyl transferase [Diaporthe amygdali]|uniref:romatic prenyl transferase n=1 Tax=Phomopsis amygdali TaxID=1214568 RepID=UPI0022FF2C74|nr:romatic prenyl transferase [Diaporthe amygdali]KAJ0124332.1 romatic prenyl transferase [Diaporthe amygdali]